jgi:hypothetical protein
MSNPKQDEILAQGVAFAQQFKVFTDDTRGRNLLSHWQKMILGKVVPPAASHAECMFHEGQRALILGIMQQIELAGTPAPKSDPFQT